MKILLVMDQFNNGNNGTTISARRFADNLRKIEHEVRSLSIGETNENNFGLKQRNFSKKINKIISSIKQIEEMFNEINLIEKAGIKVENRDYTIEELKKYETAITEFIMSYSSKNGDISKLSNEYNSIFTKFDK